MAGRGDWRAAQCVSPRGKRGEEPGGGGSPRNSSPQPGPAVPAPPSTPVPPRIIQFPADCHTPAAPDPLHLAGVRAGQHLCRLHQTAELLPREARVLPRKVSPFAYSPGCFGFSGDFGPEQGWSRTSRASILLGRVVAAADWEPAASPAQFPVAGETVSSYCTPPPPHHAAPHWLCSTRTSSTGLRVSNWRQDPKNRSASYTKKRSIPPYAGSYSLLGTNQQSSYQNANYSALAPVH